MKLQGKKIEGPNFTFIVIPRGDDDQIVFKAEAIMDMDIFDQMCPAPKPPIRKLASGEEIPNLRDEGYLTQVTKHAEKRTAWMVITSLCATEGLEWETVKLDDPDTWLKFRQELRESDFSAVEINRIIGETLAVNGLNDLKIEEARERFFTGLRAAEKDSTSQKVDLNITQPGVPVSA